MRKMKECIGVSREKSKCEKWRDGESRKGEKLGRENE
jgi:hypothetical protein